jgi:hypothetical protein
LVQPKVFNMWEEKSANIFNWRMDYESSKCEARTLPQNHQVSWQGTFSHQYTTR